MFEILKAIDLLSQNRIVRWALMVTIVIITALLVYYRVQCIALESRNSGLKRQNAELDASLALQNAAIQNQGKEYDQLRKRLQESNAEAEKLSKALKKREPITLTGNCEEMVSQVVNGIRK